MVAHVLAGCVETGSCSGTGDFSSRLGGDWSESSSVAFRDSWRVSEIPTAAARTGSMERLEGTPPLLSSPPSAETFLGSGQ